MSSLKILFVLVLILNFNNMEAQQNIDLPDFGLSFTIPNGWTGGEQGDYIILGHSTIPGMMILFENGSKDANELKELAMQGIYETGLQLSPKGGFTISSENRVEGMYEGIYNGGAVSSYAVGLINGLGKGMSILILTSTDKFSEIHRKEVEKLANSVKFYEARDSEATVHWKNKLIGRQLKYMFTDSNSDSSGGFSGTSTTRIINLCSNGEFTYYYNSNSSYAVGDPVDGISTGNQIGSGVIESTKDKTGSYKIYSAGNSSYLELIFSDDTEMEFEIGINGEGSTTLNGERYFTLDLEGCQ
ncbi:MAG: hypothetical protein KJO05_09055 [Bacteroidia bacterium]|nr:hypothetical protein [Bacteroidia bacterium]NNF31649.1 hypothetical protein [Flavobacteriaceae bacterium]MBT8276705.1 hypothetical protein [Bacteroidia bacterium]NNJ83153.1 hypothetical protein [Flavobacteriaceae bacterium]NNK55163.1 hypothetical protein [Flavobacteriaceae bacterium]